VIQSPIINLYACISRPAIWKIRFFGTMLTFLKVLHICHTL